jgi:hypothetical protein
MPQSDQRSDDDEIGPWAIRYMPKRATRLAVEAARAQNMDLGEWLARAIEHEIATVTVSANGEG